MKTITAATTAATNPVVISEPWSDIEDLWYGWGARTITLVYVLPTKSEELKFSFQNAGYGDAISFVIPEIQ